MISFVLVYYAFCLSPRPGGLDLRWEEFNDRTFSYQVCMLALKKNIKVNVETARFC